MRPEHATIAVGLLALLGVVYTAYRTSVQAAATSTTAPYAAIADRVVALEQRLEQVEAARAVEQAEARKTARRISELEDDRTTLVRVLRPIVEWDDAGRLDPPGFPGVTDDGRRLLDSTHTNA